MSSRPVPWTLDANIILRYVLDDNEELTAKAERIWQATEDGAVTAVLDPVTLAEVVFVLASVYRLPNSTISEALLPLLEADGVQMHNRKRYLHALRLFGTIVKHFGDACACATALDETGGLLYSFDRGLPHIAGLRREEDFVNTEQEQHRE